MSKRWEKALAILVVGVFSLAAIALSGLLTNLFYLHASAQHWVSTPATVVNWDLIQNSTANKSRQSKLVVNYHYLYQQQAYIGTRVDFSFGSDNFSGHRRHQQIKALRQKQVSIWVNPRSPAQSVFDRSLSIPQVTFLILFLIFPCGLGTIFLWTYLLKGLEIISGLHTERFAMPLWLCLHGMPALYPLLFCFSELSPGPFLILSVFFILALTSLIEVIRRLLNPERARSKPPELKTITAIRRK